MKDILNQLRQQHQAFEKNVIGAELGEYFTFLSKPENDKLHTEFF